MCCSEAPAAAAVQGSQALAMTASSPTQRMGAAVLSPCYLLPLHHPRSWCAVPSPPVCPLTTPPLPGSVLLAHALLLPQQAEGGRLQGVRRCGVGCHMHCPGRVMLRVTVRGRSLCVRDHCVAGNNCGG
jgi:hypothetical protein